MLHHPSFTIKFSKPLKLKATLQAEENAGEVEPFEARSYAQSAVGLRDERSTHFYN